MPTTTREGALKTSARHMGQVSLPPLNHVERQLLPKMCPHNGNLVGGSELGAEEYGSWHIAHMSSPVSGRSVIETMLSVRIFSRQGEYAYGAMVSPEW